MCIFVGFGFFESGLFLYCEYLYCQQLVVVGYEVVLMCGDQSQIWLCSWVKFDVIDLMVNDVQFVVEIGVCLLCCYVFLCYSDFVLYWLLVGEICCVDVVYIIEFCIGIMVLIVVLVKLFGKLVVYDYEQCGDCLVIWYSWVDSLWCWLLVCIGLLFVDVVWYMVLVNCEYFFVNCVKCIWEKVEMMFVLLGVDLQCFYFDLVVCVVLWECYGIVLDMLLVVMIGKLYVYKCVFEVVLVCWQVGFWLMFVGSIVQDVCVVLVELLLGDEIMLDQVLVIELCVVYSVVDVVVFIIFILLYWEVYVIGVWLLIFDLLFSCLVFEDDVEVWCYGEVVMFCVFDEEYQLQVCIIELLVEGLVVLCL